MSKIVYTVPLLSKLAFWVADHLPGRVRAAVFIDAYESLDYEYERIKTAKELDGSYSMFDAVSAVRIETLRQSAFKDGLKCGTREAKL